jgi:glutaredoxin 3
MASIRVYSRQGCHYSQDAKHLLRQRGIPFEEIDITGDPARKAEMVRLAGGRRTTPQIFIDGRHIGGASELEQRADSGQLDQMLASDAASGA